MPAFDVDDKTPRQIVLPLPEATHVYDVRAQKYLGHGGPIESTVYPGKPQMYAALPYAVESLSLSSPETATRGEAVEMRIAVHAAAGHMGPHAVRVEVSVPDGRKCEYLARTLYLPKAEGIYSFVPALNSPTGPWSVSVVEAVSGKAASAQVDVR